MHRGSKRPSEHVLKRVHGMSQFRGVIPTIELESDDWFMGRTLMEALRKVREKYPKGVFYFVRIGHRYAYPFGWGLKVAGILVRGWIGELVPLISASIHEGVLIIPDVGTFEVAVNWDSSV